MSRAKCEHAKASISFTAQKSEVAAFWTFENLTSSAVGLDLELNKGFLFSNQRARTNIEIGPAFRKNRSHPVEKLGYRLDACGFYVLYCMR